MGNGVSTAQEVQHLNADLLTWTNESQWNGNSDQGSTDDDHQPHDLPVWAGAIDENDLSYFDGGLSF